MKNINTFDKKRLEMTIQVARDTYRHGNYPVGAVLAINNKVIGKAGNEINKRKSFVHHAENSLIIDHSRNLALAREDPNKTVILYTTLEPCIQCLGASVTNHIDRIAYIQKDPNGGACNLQHDNIGIWYREFWPEIIYAPISEEPKQLMIQFFQSEIMKGNDKWAQRMIKLLDTN